MRSAWLFAAGAAFIACSEDAPSSDAGRVSEDGGNTGTGDAGNHNGDGASTDGCWTVPEGCPDYRDIPYFKCEAKKLCEPLRLEFDDNGQAHRLPEHGEAQVECMLSALRSGSEGSLHIERPLPMGSEVTDIIVLADRRAVFIAENWRDNSCEYVEVARELKPAEYFEACPRSADAFFECVTAGYTDACIGEPVCDR